MAYDDPTGRPEDDNVCKYLVELFPDTFAEWLLGSPVPWVQLQPTELSSKPI
ncbi:hypothetical protein [Thermostichus vulcanus]|uniref:Rpn family recombination-promoting nuclease/putative transposase n=1 Tax=Thermostichus vulcanus str. 'Rupite' TaxID=2813851 RepID=A0ABT0C8Y4_THEVL|nr:hypothetical protein [Thermostichus vulcanus]MCJ2542251.1 Rpn family recombination-promoting nuclease/putative transposase [Thermostichus vulcanus str. 'Rupite']